MRKGFALILCFVSVLKGSIVTGEGRIPGPLAPPSPHSIHSREMTHQAVLQPLATFMTPIYAQAKVDVVTWLPPVVHWMPLLPALGMALTALAPFSAPLSMAAIKGSSFDDAPIPGEKEILHDIVQRARSGRDLWREAMTYVRDEGRFPIPDELQGKERLRAARLQVTYWKVFAVLREHRDLRVRYFTALMDFVLEEINYLERIHGIDAALDIVKSAPERLKMRRSPQESPRKPALSKEAWENDLVSIVFNARDTIVVTSILDELIQMQFTKYRDVLKDVFSSLEGVPDAMLIRQLIYAGRLDPPQARGWVLETRLQEAMRARFKMKDIERAERALRLLAFDFEAVPAAQARELLDHFQDVYPETDPQDRDVHLMICMLAVLRIAIDPANPLIDLDPARLKEIQHTITRTRWTALEYGLSKSLQPGKLMYELGQIIYQDRKDPAIRAFLAYLFEVHFKVSQKYLPEGLFAHPHVRETMSLFQGLHSGASSNPERAAALQLAAIVHTARRRGDFKLPWGKIHWFASERRPRNVSLSRLGRSIISEFVPHQRTEGSYGEARVTSAADDRRRNRWGFYFPNPIFTAPAVTASLFESLEDPDDMTAEAVRGRFQSVIFPAVVSPSFNMGKSLGWLIRRFDDIRPLAFDELDPAEVPLEYLEMHITEKCQNHCRFCKGSRDEPGLRFVPAEEYSMSGPDMVRVSHELFELNPRAYQRTSGSIGDPAMNPDLAVHLKTMNRLGQHYGITMDGLGLSAEVLDLLVSKESSADWVGISLDAGSNKTYAELKQMRPYDGRSPGPFDLVLRNLQRILDRKKETGSTLKVIVSFLVQQENYLDIESLAPVLKAMGVNIISIKMQHEDLRRTMSETSLRELYEVILDRMVKSNPETARFQFQIIYDKEQALAKNRPQDLGPAELYTGPPLIQIQGTNRLPVHSAAIKATKCRASFYQAIVEARGEVWGCCEYYRRGKTLPSHGNIHENSLGEIHRSDRRREILALNPQDFCVSCAPDDAKFNLAMHYFEAVARSRHSWLLEEFQQTLLLWWDLEQQRQKELQDSANRNLTTAQAMRLYYGSIPKVGWILRIPFARQVDYMVRHQIDWMGHVAPDGGIHINPHLAATIAAGVFLHETAHKLIRTGLRWLHVSLTPEGEEKLASATDLVTWLPFEAAERVIEKVRFEVTFTGRRTLGRAA